MCKCVYWTKSWNNTDIIIVFPSFFEGFSVILVIIIYLILIIWMFGVYLLKKFS